MKKTLFITTLLLSAGAMFTSCNKDVENPDMQAQPEETAQVTRAYGDKTPLIEVYYEINDTNPLNALSYEMSGKKFIDLVQLFASNIQKDANGDPCIFFNDKLAPVMAAKASYIEPLQNAGILLPALRKSFLISFCMVIPVSARLFYLIIYIIPNPTREIIIPDIFSIFVVSFVSPEL